MAEQMLLGTPEEWKAIPFAPNYEVSSIGRVRSYWVRGANGVGKIQRNPKLLTPHVGKKGKGYLNIILKVEGRAVNYRINRLVALVFIPNPENKPHVDHKDSDRLNNRVENLRWKTELENVRLSAEAGLRKYRVLSDDLVREIKQKYWCTCVGLYGRKRANCTHGNTTTILAKEYGTNGTVIQYAIKRWRFLDELAVVGHSVTP